MATIVCQGIHSCHDSSQLLEPRTTLRLKLAPPKPLDQFPIKPETPISSNPKIGTWNLLQSQIPYPHSLSDKSLELCTEKLGCETGTDEKIQSISIFSESLNSNQIKEEHRAKPSRRSVSINTKMNNCHRRGDFPPPLTTISGTESIRVRPHRENGRLIIHAVKEPSVHRYFQTERSHGRLRLSVLRDCERFDSEESVDCGNGEEEDMDGNDLKDGGEMGMDEFPRPRRCNEGEGNGLLLWEPFLVATS